MKLTGLPRAVPAETYAAVLDRMVARLSRQPGVRAVLQIGNVSNPGISDIDCFVVSDDGTRCEIDQRSGRSG
jgi:hypothetical protein